MGRIETPWCVWHCASITSQPQPAGVARTTEQFWDLSLKTQGPATVKPGGAVFFLEQAAAPTWDTFKGGGHFRLAPESDANDAAALWQALLVGLIEGCPGVGGLAFFRPSGPERAIVSVWVDTTCGTTIGRLARELESLAPFPIVSAFVQHTAELALTPTVAAAFDVAADLVAPPKREGGRRRPLAPLGDEGIPVRTDTQSDVDPAALMHVASTGELPTPYVMPPGIPPPSPMKAWHEQWSPSMLQSTMTPLGFRGPAVHAPSTGPSTPDAAQQELAKGVMMFYTHSPPAPGPVLGVQYVTPQGVAVPMAVSSPAPQPISPHNSESIGSGAGSSPSAAGRGSAGQDFTRLPVAYAPMAPIPTQQVQQVQQPQGYPPFQPQMFPQGFQPPQMQPAPLPHQLHMAMQQQQSMQQSMQQPMQQQPMQPPPMQQPQQPMQTQPVQPCMPQANGPVGARGLSGEGRAQAKSNSPPFVHAGWQYPSGLNRKERRRIVFSGEVVPAEYPGAVYVGEAVPDGPVEE